MKVIKRNGTEVEFDKDKIIKAIEKAMYETELGIDSELSEEIAYNIQEDVLEMGITPTVNSIQDMVEEYLMNSDRKDVAKRYILYRSERDKIRNTSPNSKYNYLSSEFLSKYKHKPDPFSTELGKFVYYRTYSRPIPEENRRERWWETVARVVDFNTNLEVMAMKRQGIEVNEIVKNRLMSEAEKIYDMIYNLKLFPSGRSLWVGGSPSSYISAISNFNCSFLAIDELSKFAEIFLVLMLGTGCGLSVEKKYVNKLPKINSNIDVIHKDYQAVLPKERKEYTEIAQKSKNMIEVTIGDSRFGWSKAVEFYFDILSSKQYSDIEFILFNYDNIRSAGERLKTFGGYASGHIAIKQMFQKINDIFQSKKRHNNQQWQTIKPIDCLDIATIIAENVVAGGTRRSSEIVFCDKDDKEVLEAKANLYYQDSSGDWVANDKILHRMLSNNTVMRYEKPTLDELTEQFSLIRTAGEPSFGNMVAMKKRREDAQGGNPCFTGDMRLLTASGYRSFSELDGQEVKIINKDGNISTGRVWCSGEKDIFEIRFSNKQKIKCTNNHKFMLIDGLECEAKDLKGKRIMPYLEQNNIFDKEFVRYGFIQGDGCLGRLQSDSHLGLEVNIGKNDDDIADLFGVHRQDNKRSYYLNGYNEDLLALGFSSNQLPEREFPITFHKWTEHQQRSFLRGMYSANGSVLSHKCRITYKTTCKTLAEQLKKVLENMGYKPYITTNKTKTVIFDNGVYVCKESYDINLQQYQSKLKFFNEIGFEQKYKMEKLRNALVQQSPLVINVVNLETKEKVYDFSEPLVHWGVVEGFIAHNCFEIILRDRGVCNLTEVNMMGFVNEDGTYDKEGLLEAQRLSGVIGYRMASIELELHKWDLVNKEDRLTGCSLTGIMDFVNATKISNQELISLLEELRQIAHKSTYAMADRLKLNRPKLVTAIKPSGTISQLPTVSSGVHFSHSPYFIRRVRISANDPLAQAMVEAGFKWNPEVGQTVEDHKTKVFEFPVKAPQGRTKYDVSAIEQLELYQTVMKHYVDHNASNTIHVRPDEWQDVIKWVHEHWDDIIGVTFLPLDDSFYQLMPYEAITEEQYKEMLKTTPKFNPSILNKFEDFGTEFDILDNECDSGACPIR